LPERALWENIEMRREISDHILIALIVFAFGCAGQETERHSPRDKALYSAPQPVHRIQSPTWDGSPDLEPGLNGSDILLFEDFEAQNYQQRWPVHWNKPVGASTVSSPKKYVFAGKRSAYTEAKRGQHGSVGSGEYVPATPVDDVTYVRLYLRLADGFSMGRSRGLKLFSIRGGAELKNSYGGAGKRPSGRDKFSATLSIDNWRHLYFYYYHPDQRGGYGDVAYCETYFFRRAKLSPGKCGLLGSPQHPAMDTSPKDQRIYIDNFVVSRKPIGCLSAVP